MSLWASALVSSSMATAFQASLIPPTLSRQDRSNFELSFDKLLAYCDSASALKKIDDFSKGCQLIELNITNTTSTECLNQILVSTTLYPC